MKWLWSADAFVPGTSVWFGVCFCVNHGPNLLQVEVHLGHKFNLAQMGNFSGQRSECK